MSKAKFTTHSNTEVTLEYTDEYEIRQSRTFFARGHYIYEIIGYHGRQQQVCDRLSDRGNTLMIGGTQYVDDIIRREYRAMRAAAKRRELADA